MAGNDATALPFKPNRRGILYGATAAMGAAGVAAAAWPFFAQMSPDAATRAAGDVVEVDGELLRTAEPHVARWRAMPVLVLRRTPEMLAAMREPAFVTALTDPQSLKRQQPDYARNAYRSVDPQYAALVAICTYCACVPRFQADDALTPEAIVCPCCAAHYDAAGRASRGPAQHNLPVPPYSMVGGKILIGKNPPGELFSFTSVERI
jgi:ubiquinol-cytochrome c reductase iron-sulfur subunit